MAFVHHRDRVRQGERLALVVSDVHGRDPELPLQALQLEAHALAQLRVEVGERLVEQEQLRLHDERPREREALLLPAGELGRLAVGKLIELHRSEDAQDLVPNFLPGKPAVADLQRKGRVLEDVHVRPDGVGLEHHAEAAPVGRDEDVARRRIHHAVADADLPCARPLQARDRAQGRGLAAAARTEQSEQLPLRHLECHVLRGAHDLAAFVGVFGEKAFDFQHAILRITP